MKQYFEFSMAVIVFLFAVSANAAADMQLEIERAKSAGSYSVGIGSAVNLKSKDSRISGPGVFLGKAITPDAKGSYILFLSEKDQNVHYIATSHFDGRVSRFSDLQPVLNPFEQAGGTCTGYAIYDYLQQFKLSGFRGTGVLSEKLSSEKGRTTLLVDNINEYYLTPSHRYSIRGILDKYGRDFGFKCNSYSSDTYERLRDRILVQLTAGAPVVISFNLGTEMYHTPFALEMYDNKQIPRMDDRVWVPRKTGERNGGGHTIVLAGAFEFQNKTHLVTIDSDWSEPRIWDLEKFLNDRTVIEEVEIVTCKEIQ